MVSLGKLRNPIIKKSTLVKAEKEAERKYRKDEPEREREIQTFSLFSVGSCQLTVNKCADSVCQLR